MSSQLDREFMTLALNLARRGLGLVAPNPSVGCVLVRDGLVVGRGWTQPGGRPHGETRALAQAGDKARGATAYVSLEPCAHYGETPPCANSLIEAGIARVVIALRDPDPRVAGRGVEMLRAAGIEVSEGLAVAEAESLQAGFLSRIRRSRPHVTLKLATSLDGKIALANGESQWITGPEARRHGHLLRAQNDGILCGGGTLAQDDPGLTCRLPGMAACSPVRILLSNSLEMIRGLSMWRDDGPDIWVVSSDLQAPALAELETSGGAGIAVPVGADGHPDLHRVMGELAARGLTRLLVESGGKLAASLLVAGLVDEIYWYRAPIIIGNDGLPGVSELGLGELCEAHSFQRTQSHPLGKDRLEILRKPD